MNELSTTEIIKKVTSIKERVSGLDSSGRLFYEIWAFIPSTSDSYQLFYKGNNKTEKISNNFSQEFDKVLNDPSVVSVKITLKDSRKHLGNMEMTLKQAYSNPFPATRPVPIQPEKEQKQETQQPQFHQPQFQQSQNNGLNGVDMLFGLLDPEVDESKFGLLGSIMKLREKTIEDKYEKRAQDEKMERYIEQNGVLKQQLSEKEQEISALKNKIEKSSSKIDELEDELEEYEKMNPNRDIISGLGGTILGKAVLKLSENPKFSGLLGFLADEETIENTPKAAYESTVQVEAVDDSPRGKAMGEITAFIKQLDDDMFVDLYNLLIRFANKPAEINACLVYLNDEQ